MKLEKSAASFQALAVIVLLVGLGLSVRTGTQLNWASALWDATTWIARVLPVLAGMSVLRTIAQDRMHFAEKSG